MKIGPTILMLTEAWAVHGSLSGFILFMDDNSLRQNCFCRRTCLLKWDSSCWLPGCNKAYLEECILPHVFLKGARSAYSELSRAQSQLVSLVIWLFQGSYFSSIVQEKWLIIFSSTLLYLNDSLALGAISSELYRLKKRWFSKVLLLFNSKSV